MTTITRRAASILLASGALSLALFHAAIAASGFVPAIAFAGIRSDGSFNEMAYTGAERFKAETGINYLIAESGLSGGNLATLRQLVQRGATTILAVGYVYADSVRIVAAENPAIRFTILDAIVEGPNVQSVTLREQEGSFLVGMLAAMASKTGRIGFIGGIDAPLVRKFAGGYKLGALRVNPNIQVVEDTIGNDPKAWKNPERAAELARGQFARGVDVVYAAAGPSGLGVYRTAKENGKLAIGVDTNQNGLYPGTMLTSMLKRADLVTYRTFLSARDGTWAPGLVNLGLADGMVGWALDDANRALVTPEMERQVNRIAQEIITGRIRVSDYIER